MLEIITNIGIIAGGLVGLGIIWKKGLSPAYKFLRKMEEVHTIILEFPDWKNKMDHGMQQLYPNHGTSIKDVVDATARDVSTLKDLVETHISDSDAHR